MLPVPLICQYNSSAMFRSGLQDDAWVPVEMLVLYLAIEKLPVAFYQSDDRTLPAPGGGSRRHCGYVLGRQTGAVRPPPCRRTTRSLRQSSTMC